MNIQSSQEIVEYLKMCYGHYQQVGYFYDFETYKILDFVGLSHALKQAQANLSLKPPKQMKDINQIK